MRVNWTNIWSGLKILIGIYGLILFALAFSVPNNWWVIAVPLSLPFVILGIFGYLDLTGKPLALKTQSICEWGLLLIVFPSILASIQSVVSGQRIGFFSLEFGFPFILYPVMLIDLVRFGLRMKKERSKTSKEKKWIC